MNLYPRMGDLANLCHEYLIINFKTFHSILEQFQSNIINLSDL